MCTKVYWRGERILDPRKWAVEHDESIIVCRAERQVPNIATGKLYGETYEAEIPASFWNNLQWSNGWRYIAIEEIPYEVLWKAYAKSPRSGKTKL